MRGIKRVKKGISLIEVVISVAILVILMIPIASVTISTAQRNAEAEDRQRANFEGQKLLEELKSYDSMNLNVDKKDLTNIIETASLLNEKPITITDVITNAITNEREYREFETDSYQIEDGTGDFYAKVKIVRNPNATYEDVTPYTEYNDYKQKIYFYKEAIAPFRNGISLNVNTGADFDNPDTISINDIDPITTINPDTILVLKINEALNVELLKREFLGAVPSDTSLVYGNINGVLSVNGTDRILINLDQGFNDSNVNLYVESYFENPLTIDIIKGNNATGKVEIKTAIVNPITGISKTQTPGAINVTNNVSTYKQTKIGDLYTITVEITKRSSNKILFTGDAIKNIKLNTTVIK